MYSRTKKPFLFAALLGLLIAAGCGGGGGRQFPGSSIPGAGEISLSGSFFLPEQIEDISTGRTSNALAAANPKFDIVPFAGAQVTANQMNADGSLTPISDFAVTTDSAGGFSNLIAPVQNNIVLSAVKTVTVNGETKILNLKSLIDLSTADIATGSKGGIVGNVISNLTVEAMKDILAAANALASPGTSVTGSDMAIETLMDLQTLIDKALTADQTSSAPAVDLAAAVQSGSAANTQLANLESSPSGAAVQAKKQQAGQTGSVRIRVSSNGQKLAGATVNLTVDGVVQTLLTDSDGIAFFDNIDKDALLELEVIKAGYVLVSMTNTLNNPATVKNVTVQMDPATSNQAPVANAGVDQAALQNSTVALSGAASFDPDGDPLTYVWTQTSGPAVSLSDPTAVDPSFTASSAGTYIFSLVVNDGSLDSAPDTVTIAVGAVACSSDAECDDANALTLDDCLNPGAATAVCVNVAIACNTDADCAAAAPICINGGTAGAACIVCGSDADCADGSNYTLDVCSNAGAPTSACSNAPIACLTNADCDDSNDFTLDACANPGAANAACINDPLACNADADCDDANAYTKDACKNPGTIVSTCTHSAIACLSAADCDDAEDLSIDSCMNAGTVNSICVHDPIACNLNSDCDDANDYTQDTCSNPGTLQSACLHEAIACLSDADCDDADAYTQDACLSAGTTAAACAYQDIACFNVSDCNDANAYTEDSCLNAGTVASACGHQDISCLTDADCDDSNAYTEDGCLNPGTTSAACDYQDIVCLADADCDDANDYTQDACLNAGTTASSCDYQTIACLSDADCDDGQASTVDLCENAGAVASACYSHLDNAWITIPASEFIMGCDSADPLCFDDEMPQHTVYLSEFRIQRYEVTNAQFKACVDAGACTAPQSASSKTVANYYGNHAYDDYPLLYADWSQADAYCAWAGGRLPSEAQWEKTARGASPSEIQYPWGAAAPACSLANAFVNGSFCNGDVEKSDSHNSGASPYGAMNMAGNVAEWINEWYDDGYYFNTPYQDPPGATTGFLKIVRGGSWSDSELGIRALTRGVEFQNGAKNDIGFRCAADPAN